MVIRMKQTGRSTRVDVEKSVHVHTSWNGRYSSIDTFMEYLEKKNPGEGNFLESVEEVLESVWDLLADRKEYMESNLIERITEPERVIQFRVPWMDDKGFVHVNRGYRIEFNSALGPFKGGLRFHPTVNQDVLKFLGFEQTFKNSLTTLPMGGGKGGSDFDPKGKSDSEVMRFCQSFMSELVRYIGERTDVPAGDIGVGSREIGYLFGQYKRISNRFDGALTGKGIEWGGSPMRAEATGYGVVYFVQEMFTWRQDTLEEKEVVISGSGNVAQYAADKILQYGGKLIAMSDSKGTVHAPDGFTAEMLEFLMELKNVKRGTISELADEYSLAFLEGKRPWHIPCEVAIPCATENELDQKSTKQLIHNGCICVAEGANKPATPGAIQSLHQSEVLYAPGKAANAGGVAVSGLEMTQNATHTRWSAKEVDDRLQGIMKSIHEKCVEFGEAESGIDYLRGANRAGFIKVADSMIAQGIV